MKSDRQNTEKYNKTGVAMQHLFSCSYAISMYAINISVIFIKQQQKTEQAVLAPLSDPDEARTHDLQRDRLAF